MSTKRFYIIGFGALMLFDTLTQVSFKLATTHAGEFTPTTTWLWEVFFNPWIYGAVIGYIGSFITWMTLLKHAPVGPAFAASHLEVVTVLAISVLYFGEHLSAMQVLGALLIVGGIICLSKSEAEHEPPPQETA
ncbi:permease [Novimethylophilus kurashikiensis]|uniref:Permease n=1 Tax=Novimethylophilus kurashikiensis TaxID=1825523 RepID=A0A2R5FEN3_9PROT|nr:SMR family transporter [Novimethylophilus kurashikiensis]GBG15183.1 permease [Novimethylophilus kurashikiensis]